MARTFETIGIVLALSFAPCALCAALDDQEEAEPGVPGEAAPTGAGPAVRLPSTIKESCLAAQNDARAQALKALLEAVLALKVNETRTVKDFIGATDLPKAEIGVLLQGVVEYQPPLIYGDGTCEADLTLNGEALKANLKSIRSKYYKKEGEYAALTFDSLPAGPVMRRGISEIVLPRAGGDRTIADGVPGWEDVSARKRIQTERIALQDALAKLKTELDKTQVTDSMTFAGLEAAKPLAKEAVEKFLKKMLPETKLYYPQGIVEVRVSMDYPSLLAAIEAANRSAASPVAPIDAAVLAAAKEQTKSRGLTMVGYAQLSGKPVGPADVVRSTVAVDAGVIQAAKLDRPDPAPRSSAAPAGGEKPVSAEKLPSAEKPAGAEKPPSAEKPASGEKSKTGGEAK